MSGDLHVNLDSGTARILEERAASAGLSKNSWIRLAIRFFRIELPPGMPMKEAYAKIKSELEDERHAYR